MGNHLDLGTYLSGSTTLKYEQQDLTFQGLIYSKGANGFVSYPPQTRFGFQGAMVTTKGGLTLGDGTNNPGQINFIFDPASLLKFYTLGTGNPIATQWIIVR